MVDCESDLMLDAKLKLQLIKTKSASMCCSYFSVSNKYQFQMEVVGFDQSVVVLALQEEVSIGQDGSEMKVSILQPNSTFGQISIFCNIPQSCTVRVLDLCRLLRIDKESLSNIIDIYFNDGKIIFNNLLKVIRGAFFFSNVGLLYIRRNSIL